VTTRVSRRNLYTSFTCKFPTPTPSKPTVGNKGPQTVEYKSEIPTGRRSARAIIKRTRWDRLCVCVWVCVCVRVRARYVYRPRRQLVYIYMYMCAVYIYTNIYDEGDGGPGWRQCDDDSTATVCYDTWTRWPGGGICQAGDLRRPRTRLWLHLYGQVSTTMYTYII